MRYSVPQTTWFKPMPSYVVNDAFFSTYNREFDQFFDEFRGYTPFGGYTSAAPRCATPRMSMSETDKLVEIEAELPGIEEKDVEVALSGDVLTIKGEKTLQCSEPQKDYYYQERAFCKFARSITLPFEPDPNSVKTYFSKGILRITLPKTAGIKQHTVKIPIH